MKNLKNITDLIKNYKPISPGIRQRIRLKTDYLKKCKNRFLFRKLRRRKFVNSSGNLVNYNRCFGKKKLYRIIDFKRIFFNYKGTIINIEYDPNRNVSIALIQYINGTYSYVLKNEGMILNNYIFSYNEKKDFFHIGDNFILENIPIGMVISNISDNNIYNKSKYIRSAGMSARIMSKDKNNITVKFLSGRIKKFNSQGTATIGSISNNQWRYINLGKAGTNKWRGYRSNVRGVAMNPIDHPHGGGNGKTSGGRPSVSRWNKLTKNKKKQKKLK